MHGLKGLVISGLFCGIWWEALRTFMQKSSTEQYMLQSDNELLMSEMQKNLAVTDFV